MADQKITIEIDGKDNASPVMKKVGMSVTDLNSAMTIATRVYDVAAQAFKMTVNEAQAYDQQIRDVMLSTGATAEESSRLVQVVDDAGVSYGVLKTAMKMASKEGIEPNIASLQSLSDKYLQLAPGVERNKFLMDTFGKSGLEMARVMELGGDALGKMNDEIDGGLVLTQEAIDQSEEYRKNIDELTDAWTAFKVTVGNSIIPVINDSIEANKKHNTAMERAAELTGTADKRTNQWVASLILESDALNENASSIQSYTAWAKSLQGEMEATTEAAEDNSEAIEYMTKVNQEYLSTIGDLSDEMDDYNDRQADLTGQHAELLAEKQKLLDQGWWAESDAVQEVNDKLAENEEKQAENADAMEESTHRRMLAMLEEQLSIDGLDEKESAFLLKQGVEWGLYSETAISAMAAIQRQVDAMERNIDININVHTNYSTAGQAALSEQIMGEKGYTPTRGNATGGNYTIPMSYGNEGFRMSGGDTASGGEQLTITPKGKSGNEDVIAAIERNRLSEERLAQLFEGVMLRISR